METQRTQIYDVPLPRDPSRVTAVHDGKKWISSIEPGSLEFDDDTVTFIALWNHRDRMRITIALDLVTGYQERA